MKKARELFYIFTIGAVGYSLLEILWRKYTHWTMAITGGICFLLIYRINIKLKLKHMVSKCVLGALAITMVEFLVGWVVNVKLKWNVWDYSSRSFNLLGQVCALYSFLWFLLCIPLNFLCNAIHKHFFLKKEI